MEGALECFGQYAHTITGEVVNLGVDFSIGSKGSRLPNKVNSVKGPRVCSKKVPNLAKRRCRWSKALRRMPKIRNLRGKAGSKAKLFFVGQKPSMTYGSDVVGLGPREVHKLRVLGAKALGIWCPGAPIDLIWATESSKDPISHAGDTIVRYAREWWEATDPQLRASDGLSAGTLTKAFHACLEKLIATPPSLGWRRRGTHPILDALLWGVEAGWIFNNQASFTSASGIPVGLTDSPPELVRKFFVQDIKRKYLAESVNMLVQFCEAIDSVWHRIWICPQGASVRIALDQDLLEEAISAGEQDPLYSSLWVPVPELELEPPVEDFIRYFDANGPIDPFTLPHNAKVFSDGSVWDPKTDVGARGGWAAVEVDGDGNLIRGLMGSIPRGLPQTAVLAEHHGFMHTIEHQDQDPPPEEEAELNAFVDCSALIWGSKDLSKASRGTTVQSGHWRRIKRVAPRAWTIHKVKAHLEEDSEAQPRVARVLATGQGILFCNRCGSYTTGRHPKDLVGGCFNVKKKQARPLGPEAPQADPANDQGCWPRGGIESVASRVAAIKDCGATRQWRAALGLLREAPRSRAPAEAVVYNVAIAACGKGRQWQQSLLLLDEMREASTAPDVVSYSAGMSACERGGRWQQALSLLGEMCETALEPNIISFSAGISACAKGGQWQRALSMLRDLGAAKLEQSAISATVPASARARKVGNGSSLCCC
ncbi:unnamed protein product [Prorocentrum cordatum]|uniref:Pentatricopeptide repeat-containing protein, chloroplastic n=1 Tax=Prorocentrum cordatum TaxID=2364126 RepID=A0ABN9VNA4_9DINO|nr:unnamed protein product [Polarella glacialis]